MSFTRKQGKTKILYLPKKASTVFDKGDLVMVEGGGTGFVTVHDGSAAEAIGVCRVNIRSTDVAATEHGVGAYSGNGLLPVEVPVELFVTWKATGVVGTAVATDIGAYIDVATTDPGFADRSTSADDILWVTKFVSATELEVVISKLAAVRGD